MNLPRIAFCFSAVTIVMALFILSIVPPIGGYPTITPTAEPTEATTEPAVEATYSESEPTDSPTELVTEPEPEPTEPLTEPPTEAPTEPVTEPPTEVPTEPEVRYFDVPLSEDLQDYIFYLCDRYAVDPRIVIAMIRKESTYNPELIGDDGYAFGLMQIQPQWHQERMDKLGAVDLLNPYHNVYVGIDYLAEMLSWGGSIEWALMAYNAGPSYAWELEAEGRVSYYARTVLEYAEELRYA